MSTAATKRRIGVISTVVVALVAGLLVWVATRSDGEVVRKADLNDGGIWVTNADQARFGRINKAAGQLDAGVLSDGTPGSGLDVFQDGAAVVGLSKAGNQLVPINPAEGTLATAHSIVLPKAAPATGNRVFETEPVDLRGGTIAMIDPAKGELRAQRVDNRSGIAGLDQLQTQAKPLVTVGANATVAVGVDGTVYALSGAKGVLAILKASGPTFAKPVLVKLGLETKSAQVTAVGSHWVVFDSGTGLAYSDLLEQPQQVSVGRAEPGKPVYAALQQPGPDSAAVLVQDESQLVQVPLTGEPAGPGVKLAPAGPGADSPSELFLSAPVRLGSCVHAAWAGASNAFYGRNCGSPQDTQTVGLGAMKNGVRVDGVKLRVNRGLIVLNDLDSGDVWDIDRDRVKIDNWNSVIPPPQVDNKNKKKDENLIDDEVDKTPPKAQPDQLKVRPGRTSTLHVLDNDTDSQGSILAISPGDVGTPSIADVATSASADGQTVQVTVPEEPAADRFTFEYTVNNGTTAKNGRATAKVTVTIVGPDENTAPKLRGGSAKLAKASYPVARNATVKVGVIADWRDAENDPLQVSPVDPAATGVDGAGALIVRALGKKGDQEVEYEVSDSNGGVTTSAATVQVLGDDDRAVAPRTQPDVLRGVVGKPVQLQPLGNDIPGADPTDPEARLRLASEVKGPGQLTIDTNTDTGVLTVTGATPGTSTITYAAQSGSGVSVGRVRVDILPDPDKELPPVASPDSAVVRGQTPVIADVLSNDYSPRSDVLVVQRVVTDNAWLRVSVVQGRWVRVEATAPLDGDKERRGTVAYTVSDGTQSAVGQLSVVQKPAPDEPILPTVLDDTAAVRVGDAVTIPVLDNDSMSEGIPLKLDPLGVRVRSGGGQAFASGSVLRYVPEPDAKATAPRTAVLEYIAHPEGLRARSATGRVTVTINPLPGETRPNRPPTARSFSASVTAGDTLSITVPTSGVDPDGDLAFVGGIVGETGDAVDLRLGRVLGFGAATIRYEAYPRSAGTEVIRYQLRDRFGLTSEGFIRVGVVQPGDPQPPVAVEDDIVAAPGRTVHADLLANDLIASGDAVELEDFARLNDADVLKDFERQQDDSVKVVAPEEGPAKVLAYGITNRMFDPSRSTLTVRGQKDFNNPPIAVDDTGVAKDGDTSILVDALSNDRDVDGDQQSLTITKVIGDGATIEGRKVHIQLRPEARVVPYTIEDADGAVAMALIYVPAGNNGQPYVASGKTIRMDADATTKVRLADYVMDPRGGTVSLTSPDTISTSPAEHLQHAATSSTELTLTSTNGYVGPAALMLEVTNATGPQDKSAQTAYVTIPVQIGPDVPVLRCPDHEVRLVADGPSRIVDIPRLCRAWLPNTLDQSRVRYEAVWDQAVDRVDLTQTGQGGRTVVLQAGPAAQAGSTGTVTIGAKGGAERFTLRVRVTAQPPNATLRPARVEGLIAGTKQQVNLAQHLDSPLGSPQCEITTATMRAGTGVTATAAGCQLTVAASEQARGDARIEVRVTDAPGRPPAVGEVTVTVRSKPDPTDAPVAVADRVLGGTARVDWRPPAYDGGLPILEYEVRVNGPGGTDQTCQASPCTITGLTNGEDYTFTVRSRNAVGWSDPSDASSPPVRPDTLPRATAISNVVPGDRQLTVSWTSPVNEGSEITQYQVQWVNVGGNAGQTGTKVVQAPELSTVVSGLVNNDAYKIRVQARNDLGWGPYGPEVTGQSFGKPAPVAAPSLAPRSPAPDQDNAQVTITWPTTDPNGPPITQYDVYRRTGSTGAWVPVASVSGGAQRVATDTIPYGGQTVQYTVSATNGGSATSERTNFSSYKADGMPQTPTLSAVGTPNADYRAVASYSLGSHRSTGYDRVEWRTTDGAYQGTWPAPSSGGTTGNVGINQKAMEIRACNAAGICSAWSNDVTFNPYGPTKGVGGISESHTDSSITFSWSKPADNGNAIQGYRIRGDVNTTLGPNQTSYTFSGLGYSTTRTITVTPFADRSGDGPTAGPRSGTTNAAPPPPAPKVNWLAPGSSVSRPDCGSSTCAKLRYDLSNFQGSIRCTFDSSDGTWPYNWDDGSNGTIRPVNGTNDSGKYFGFPNGWVKVTCYGSNGSDSFTRNPWQ